MAATTPTVTPTIVPVHDEELELIPAPDCCVALKEEIVVVLPARGMVAIAFMVVEVAGVAVDTVVVVEDVVLVVGLVVEVDGVVVGTAVVLVDEVVLVVGFVVVVDVVVVGAAVVLVVVNPTPPINHISCARMAPPARGCKNGPDDYIRKPICVHVACAGH